MRDGRSPSRIQVRGKIMSQKNSRLVDILAKGVKQCQAEFDSATGRFLAENGGWAVTNQDVIWPLAWLYTNQHPENPWCDDRTILDLAMAGGDALRNAQDPDGRWEFVKIDGSRWGKIYMPWSSFHWLETYDCLREHLGESRKKSWEDGLRQSYEGICREKPVPGNAHNIPTWNAAALFKAGIVFQQEEWRNYARQYFRALVKAMHPDGFWPEGGGPTTSYNLVYAHALGLYYSMSRDEAVRPAINAVTNFHRHFTYPDGACVETIDGRCKYDPKPSAFGLPCFMVCDIGTMFSAHIADCLVKAYPVGLCSPHIASALTVQPSEIQPKEVVIQQSDNYHAAFKEHAAVRKNGGFYTCVSGYVMSLEDQVRAADRRWIQDRSVFVSVWHEKSGLIVGGGNSKDHPLWANFSVWQGNWRSWCPISSSLLSDEKADTLRLDYNKVICSIRLRPLNIKTIQMEFAVDEFGPATKIIASLLLKLQEGMEIKGSDGAEMIYDPLRVSEFFIEPGKPISTAFWNLESSLAAAAQCPAYPFNPYAIDGSAPPKQACCRIGFDLTRAVSQNTISLTVKYN
jgi:hypothetical protein